MLAVAGLFLPSLTLAAATPLAARGSIVSTSGSGSVVGRVSAIATVGALIGTFLTGFVLLALAPVPVILLGAAVALAVTGITLHLGLRGLAGAGPVAALALAAATSVAAGASIAPVCDPPSAYYCIRIGQSESQPAIRDLVLDDLVHGSIDLDSPATLRLRYLRTMDAIVEGARPAPARSTRSTSAAARSRCRGT